MFRTSRRGRRGAKSGFPSRGPGARRRVAIAGGGDRWAGGDRRRWPGDRHPWGSPRGRISRQSSGSEPGTALANAQVMSRILLVSFFTSLAVAVAVLGRLSFGAPARAPERWRDAEGRRPEPSSEAKNGLGAQIEVGAPNIEMAEIRIVGRRVGGQVKRGLNAERGPHLPPRLRSRSRPRPPTLALVPCSEPEELGPVNSTRAGERARTRYVRRLCTVDAGGAGHGRVKPRAERVGDGFR